MIISEIIELPNGRRKIILDNGESFVLYKGELKKKSIELGSELEEEYYEFVMKEILPKRAKLRGLNLLKARPYTEYQIRQKYIEGGYPKEIIDTTIEYLKAMKLIDDREYCRVFFTYKSDKKSKKRMFNDLMIKGVSKEIIEEVFIELSKLGDINKEEELVLKIFNKRNYKPESAQYEEKQKMISYLYSKGIDMALIKAMV